MFIFRILVLNLCFLVVPAFHIATGQQTQTNSTVQDEQAETLITAETIKALASQAAESTELDDATKAEIKSICDKAELELNAAADVVTQSARFQAPKTDETRFDFSDTELRELGELNAELVVLENRLSQSKDVRSGVEAIRTGQSERLGTARQELADARNNLQVIDQDLSSLNDPADIPVLLVNARRLLLAAQKQHVLEIVSALENELSVYQQGLPDQWYELANNSVEAIEADVRQLREIVSQMRTNDAAAQKFDAEKRLSHAPPALQEIYQQSVTLADQWLEMDARIISATAASEKAENELQRWQQDFEQTHLLADHGNSRTLGLLLAKKRYSIPSTAKVKRDIVTRSRTIREVQLELFNLREAQVRIGDETASAEEAIRNANRDGVLPDDAQTELEKAYVQQQQLIQFLIRDNNRYQDLLLSANQDEEGLVRLIHEYDEFIRARLFWVRNTSIPSLKDTANARNAFSWLSDASSWRSVGREIMDDAVDNPDLTIVAIGILLLLVVPRRQARHRIKGIGKVASRVSCREFRLTIQAFLLSLVLALPIPLILAYGGWRLRQSSEEFTLAIASGLLSVAPRLLLLEGIRQVCRTGGLGSSHFGWSRNALDPISKSVWVVMLLGLPFQFFSDVLAAQEFEPYNTSLGRFCFVGWMVVWAIAVFPLMRPRGSLSQAWSSANYAEGLKKLGTLSGILIFLIPVGLSILALVGYYYTARQLGIDLLITLRLVVCLLLLYALMERWVRVKRRRLRWQQAMEYRAQAQSSADESIGEIEAMVQSEEGVNLVEIDHQTRRILRSVVWFIALVSLWLIWSEVIPALAILGDLSIWPGTIDGITWSDVFFTVLISSLTVILAKNAPGLIDILVLEQLSMESSIRYAISTLTRYVIVIGGVLVATHVLGFPWNKVQWLIAALGVGLGFGLQEIVANFVSGVILLFERPIRVGDVVTVGESTGIVTRISIRATRIRNWDRQELLIPNRELVTGRIVNWTLSDSLNRLVFSVGVAYGTDTRKTRDLLQQILAENDKVVRDPEPVVTFAEFGDSTLNFTIRAVLASIDDRLETTHELHSRIHDRFAEEGIEIAFPQLDVKFKRESSSLELPATD